MKSDFYKDIVKSMKATFLQQKNFSPIFAVKTDRGEHEIMPFQVFEDNPMKTEEFFFEFGAFLSTEDRMFTEFHIFTPCQFLFTKIAPDESPNDAMRRINQIPESARGSGLYSFSAYFNLSNNVEELSIAKTSELFEVVSGSDLVLRRSKELAPEHAPDPDAEEHIHCRFFDVFLMGICVGRAMKEQQGGH